MERRPEQEQLVIGWERHMPVKNEECLLSVIIPVYNVELYLEHCLSTVLACQLEDCEVLLSLGASSDRSSGICAVYAERFPILRILFQRGTGLSDARNSALDAAKGRYILFLDSDDYVDSVQLDKLIGRLREPDFSPDVVVTDFCRLDRSTGHITKMFQIGADTPERHGMEFLASMLRKRQCFWNVWRYVYRRNFLEGHGLRFTENRLSEDVGFTANVFLCAPEIVFLHCPYYVYGVRRGDSLMDRPTLKRLEDTVWMLTRSIRQLRQLNLPYASLLTARFQFEYLLNLALASELPSEDRKDAFALYQDWPAVMAGSADPLVRTAAIALRLLGLRVVSNCLFRLKLVKRRLRRYLR